MTASNLLLDKRKPTPTLKAIYPPASASMDPVNFGHWLKEVGIKLLRAGIEVQLIPMVNADMSLWLGVEVDDDTARAIKKAMYH
jgi:hypothetical protein